MRKNRRIDINFKLAHNTRVRTRQAFKSFNDRKYNKIGLIYLVVLIHFLKHGSFINSIVM